MPPDLRDKEKVNGKYSGRDMKAPTVKSVLAAFKANQQPVQVELRPDGTTAFIPIIPMVPSTSHDPVMEALRRAS